MTLSKLGKRAELHADQVCYAVKAAAGNEEQGRTRVWRVRERGSAGGEPL